MPILDPLRSTPTLTSAVTDRYTPQALMDAEADRIRSSTSFGRGWTSAGLQEDANDLMSRALAAGQRGDKMAQQALELQAMDTMARSQQWAPSVQNFTDIAGPGDALSWAGGALGNMRSSVIPAVGGGIGALAGVATAPLTGGFINPMTGARIGASLGSALAGYKTERDEAVANAFMDDQIRANKSLDEIDRAASVKGLANAALEGLVPGAVGKSVTIGGGVKAAEQLAKNGAKKYLAKTVGKDMLEEGATEGSQSLVGQAAQNTLLDKNLSDFDYRQALNEAAAGAVAGGGMGALGGVGDIVHDTGGEAVSRTADAVKNPVRTATDAISAIGRKGGELAAAGANKIEDILDERAAKEAGLPVDLYRALQTQPDLRKEFKDTSEELRARMGSHDGENFRTIPKGDDTSDPVAVDSAARLRADKHAVSILKSPNGAFSEAEKEAARRYMTSGDKRDYNTFGADLDAASKAASARSIADEIERHSKKVKKSKIGMTERGREAGILTDYWLKNEGSKFDLFKSGGEDAKRSAMALMEWVRSGYGAEHNNGELFIPKSLVDELGGDAAKVQMSMYKLLRAQGLMGDDKATLSVHDQLKQHAMNKSTDSAFIDNMLTPIANDNWNERKRVEMLRFLRDSKGSVPKNALPFLRENFGDKVDDVLAHFNPENTAARYESKTKSVNEWKDNTDATRDAASSAVDSGSDNAGITDNDGDFNSGVSEKTAPKLKLNETFNRNDKPYYDIRDDADRKKLEEKKLAKHAEEIGAIDHVRSLYSGDELRAAENDLLNKYHEGRAVGTAKHSRKAALQAINTNHRILIRPEQSESVQITKDNLKDLKASPTRYDKKTNTETKIDDKSRGRVYIELANGKTYLTSAGQLIQAVSQNDNEDQSIGGESAEKGGAAQAEMKFHNGLGQVLDALQVAAGKNASKMPTGRVGFKHSADGEITWLNRSGETQTGMRNKDLFAKARGVFNFPKDFNYLYKEEKVEIAPGVFKHKPVENIGMNRNEAAKAAPYVGKKVKRESSLTISDAQNMTVGELEGLRDKLLDKLGGMNLSLSKMLKSQADNVEGMSKAIDRAKKVANNGKRVADLQKQFEIAAKALEIARQKHAPYTKLRESMEGVQEQLDQLQQIIDDRVQSIDKTGAERAPGEKNYAARIGKAGEGLVSAGESREKRTIVRDKKTIVSSMDDAGGIAAKNQNVTDDFGNSATESTSENVPVYKTKVLPESFKGEMEEFSEASAAKENDTPIERNEADGTERVPEPKDSEGFWKESEANKTSKFAIEKAKRETEKKVRAEIAEAERKLDFKKVAELRAKLGDSELLSQKDREAFAQQQWVIRTLRKGMPAVRQAIKAMTDEQRSKFANMLRGDFLKGALIANDAEKATVLKERAAKALAALDELGETKSSAQKTSLNDRTSVSLPNKTAHAKKDQLKSDKANKFIGRGSPNSSTASYAKAWGDNANTGNYSESDIVFISAEGARTGRIAPDFSELKKAISAGSKIITDSESDRSRPYNVGEREVSKYLEQNGYREELPGEWVKTVRKSKVTSLSEKRSEKLLGRAKDILSNLTDEDVETLQNDLLSFDLSKSRIPSSLKESFQEWLSEYHPIERETMMAHENITETETRFLEEVSENWDDGTEKALATFILKNETLKQLSAQKATKQKTVRKSRMSTDIHNDLGNVGFAATHDSPIKHAGEFNWREHSGKGEGNAAFGAGTYLSTDEGVHSSYKNKFTAMVDEVSSMIRDLAENITGGYNPEVVEDVLKNKLSGVKTIAEVKDKIEKALIAAEHKELEETGGAPVLYSREYLKNGALDREIYEILNRHRGGVSPTYHVSVNIKPEELLDWDNPIGFTENTTPALQKLAGEVFEKTAVNKATVDDYVTVGEYTVKVFKGKIVAIAHTYGDFVNRGDNDFDNVLKKACESYVTGEDIYRHLVKKLGSQAKASDHLQKLGVLGHKYASESGSNNQYPNYVIYDDSKITTNHVSFNKQKASKQETKLREQVEKAKAHILKVVGEHINTKEWPRRFSDGSSGEWEAGDVMNTIRVALNGDVLGTAFHESFHELMDILRKNGGDKVVDTLQRAASSKLMQNRLSQLLDGHKEAQDQLSDPEEAAAYMYQFFTAGKLTIGPDTRSAFENIRDFLRGIAALFSDTIRKQLLSEKVARLEGDFVTSILSEFNAGSVASLDTRRDVVEALNRHAESHEKAVNNVGAAFKKLDDTIGKYVYSAEAMMDATGNKYAVANMRDFNQKAGTSMRTIGGVKGAYFDGLRSNTNHFMNRMENILLKGDAADHELVRKALSTGKMPTHPKALEMAKDIRQFFKEMGEYMSERGVQRLNMELKDENGNYGVWENVELRKDYFPQVFDMETLLEKADEFRKDLLDHHMDNLKHLARDANVRLLHTLINNGHDYGAPGSAQRAEWDRMTKEFLENGTPIGANNMKPVTAEDIADAIHQNLISTYGQKDIQETSSELGITPASSAVNRRVLDWLDPEVFDKYIDKDLVNILTTYTRNMVKRGEYQARFGPDGGVIRDRSHAAVLFEMGGDGLVKAAKDGLKPAIKEWNKEAAAWHKANPDGGTYPVPFPNLLSVGNDIHRGTVGGEKQQAALADAVRKLEHMFNTVQALEGTLGRDISPTLRSVNSWLVAYQSFSKLSMMLFTSFTDVLGIAVNGGEMRDAWDAFVAGIREVRKSWANDKTMDAQALRAEDWGLLDAGSLLDTLGQAQGSVFMSGKAKHLTDKFFRIIGAEGWNRGIRAAAGSIAERTILGWVRNGVDMNDKAAVARLERLYGKGAKVEDIKLDSEGRLDATNPANRAAINRWVLDAIPAPNAAHRPIWGSDPHYQAFMHLKNYTYTQHRVLLNGAIEQARLGNYRPAMMLATGYVPVAIAAGAMKEMLIPGEEPPWMQGGLDDYLSYGFQRAGILGVPQMYAEGLFDADPAQWFGPTVNQLQDILTIPFDEHTVNLPFLGKTGMSDHTIVGEALKGMPAGNLLSRLAYG